MAALASGFNLSSCRKTLGFPFLLQCLLGRAEADGGVSSRAAEQSPCPPQTSIPWTACMLLSRGSAASPWPRVPTVSPRSPAHPIPVLPCPPPLLTPGPVGFPHQ